jgi:hypothetical protein
MKAKENAANILVIQEPVCKDNNTSNNDTITLAAAEKIEESYPEDLEKIFSPDTKHKKNILELLAEFHHSNEYFFSCNRKESYEELVSRQPAAVKHKEILEKSFFLHEWRYAYLQVEEQIKALLREANAENLGSYSWFMKQSRDLTRIYNGQFSKNVHLYIHEAYISYLQEKVQDSIVSPKIRSLLPQNISQTPKTSFASTDHKEPRVDKVSLGDEEFISTHLPANFAHNELSKLWYTTVSSRNWLDNGCDDNGDRTCTHWLQPVVLAWLEILEKKIQNTYGVRMDWLKIIRWGTEHGHFFSSDKKSWLIAWFVAWQSYPGYKKKIALNTNKNNVSTGTIKKPRLLFTTHGYGTTIDLSIASPEWSRAMEELLSWGLEIWLWYKLVPIGANEHNEELYMICIQHGEDTNYHFHIWFVTKSQLQACNVLRQTTKITEPLPNPVTALSLQK